MLILQKDVDSLCDSSLLWQLKFNATKCTHMTYDNRKIRSQYKMKEGETNIYKTWWWSVCLCERMRVCVRLCASSVCVCPHRYFKQSPAQTRRVEVRSNYSLFNFVAPVKIEQLTYLCQWH